MSYPRQGKRLALADTIRALMTGPKTAVELAQECGPSDETIRIWLGDLRASGVVYISELRRQPRGYGRLTRVWALQPSPFERADVVGSSGPM